MSNRDQVKESVLRAATAIVPAQRVIVYEVDSALQPFGHVSSWSERYWGELYRRFVELDPYHPRHFAQSRRSVFGTRDGFSCVRESPDYIAGFRHAVGVAFKAELFFRDDRGRIRGGVRFARTPGSSEFTRREMETLEAIQPVFSAAWCSALPPHEDDPLVLALSTRERQVLDLALAGKSNEDIGRALGLAIPTIKHHVRSILSKTGTRNRRELLSAFYRRQAANAAPVVNPRPH